MTRLIYVVRRGEHALYQNLLQSFAERDDVQVVMDRRFGERRTGSGPPLVERRRGDRRWRTADENLQILGWTLVHPE